MFSSSVMRFVVVGLSPLAPGTGIQRSAESESAMPSVFVR
jgi:hypothetical protein